MFDSVRVATRGQADTIVVGVFKGEAPDRAVKALDKDGSIAAAAARTEFTGAVGNVAEAFPKAGGGIARVLVAGLGKKDDHTPGSLRAVAGAVGRRLAAAQVRDVRVELAPTLATRKGTDLEACGRSFGEGLGLVAWTYDKLKGKASDLPKRMKLAVRFGDGDFAAGADYGLRLAEGANLARTLSQTPPNIATTAFIANEAKKLARATGMKCTVIEGPALERERLTGLINVGKASEFGPCLVRLEYNPPKGARARKPAVLVGKTMVYDTGGLSLKISGSMVGMKRDKDGGCAVLGAMHAIATVIKPRIPVVALLAVAENSVSDEAYRPDDVLTFRNGVTVEVTNTDAEGRLVLADALCWACEKENPAYIVDIATLTGGVVVALGGAFAGMFCEDDKLRARIDAASALTGERAWRLPMDAYYRDMMKSPIADILNSNPNREAHPIQGAAFLSYFVSDNIPWCHLDIAAVHAVDRDVGPFIKGPTGWGARLLAEIVGMS